MHLVHVVNTCDFDASAQLSRAQALTVETMRHAARHAELDGHRVDLVAVCHPEDAASIPEGFDGRPTLAGSVQDDVPDAPRRLPRLREILEVGLDGTEATTAIWTNVDIALVPHFYSTVADMLEHGDPSLIINRRTVQDIGDRVKPPPPSVLASLVGKKHGGRDCFVFPVEAMSEFVLGDVVVGAPGVGRVLQWNLEKVCGPVVWRRNVHLTYHLGEDAEWYEDDRRRSSNDFNFAQAIAAYDTLVERHGPFTRFRQHPAEQRGPGSAIRTLRPRELEHPDEP